MIRSILAAFVVMSGTGYSAHATLQPLKITPLGRPDVPVAGTFNRNLPAEPDSFSPLSGGDAASRQVFEYVNEGLLDFVQSACGSVPVRASLSARRLLP